MARHATGLAAARLFLAACALSLRCPAAERAGGLEHGALEPSAGSDEAADGPQHFFGGKRCDAREWEKFTAVFPGADDARKLHFSSKAPCPKDNVLWLYPTEDDNGAFGVDAYVCYRLMYWHERACSVSVQRVDGPEEAKKEIERYAEGSIIHLTLGGHGDGKSLAWGEDSDGELAVYTRDSHDFLEAAARRLADTSTILLDSCYGSTEHAMESLSHYVARILASARRESGGRPDFAVFGTVYSQANEELLIREGTDAGLRAGFANIHGMREYRPLYAPRKPLAPGDWVRSYKKRKKGRQSSSTRTGFVREAAGDKVGIDFCGGDTQGDIPQAWVTQHAPLGSEVEAQIQEKGMPLTRARLVGQARATPADHDDDEEDDEDVLAARVKDGDAEVTVPCDLVRPIDLVVRSIAGSEYPSVGDWVRVRLSPTAKDGTEHEPPTTFAAAVVSLSKDGAMVKLGDLGRSYLDTLNRWSPLKMLRKRTSADPIDIDVQDLEVQAKAGMLMAGNVWSLWGGTPWEGSFLGGATDRGVLVRPEGAPEGKEQLFPLDSVVSVRSGGSDVFRSSVAGCACRRLAEDEMADQKFEACGSEFCCRRGGQETCRVENAAACGQFVELQPCLGHGGR